MSRNAIQPSFAAGELAPSLYARTDLAKFHIGAKKLENFFVHAHGGASNRPGTAFVGRAFRPDSSGLVRLIPFQFNTTQTYVLEFGNSYMRVIMNGGHVLETAKTITGISNGNPCVVTCAGHGYDVPNEVYITGVSGMSHINGRRFQAVAVDSNHFSLKDLDGNNVNASTFGTYTSGGTVARVYTLWTDWGTDELPLLKFTQSADTMTITHPSVAPKDLTRTGHASWTLTDVAFQPGVSAPAGVTATPSSSGNYFYGYVVTALTDSPAEESRASFRATCSNAQLNQNTGIQNVISWKAVSGATRYNIYKASPVYSTGSSGIPVGATYGYIGNATGTSFVDLNIAADFSRTPPNGTNPFSTVAINSVSVTAGGSGYPSTVPMMVVDTSGSGSGAIVSGTASGGVIQSVAVNNGGVSMVSPVILPVDGTGAGGQVQLTLGTGANAGKITGATISKAGTGYTNPTITIIDGTGTGAVVTCTVTTGGLSGIVVSSQGSGYSSPYAVVTDSAGTGATFSASLATTHNYPGVTTYFEQRKMYAASTNNPQTIWGSKVGAYKNMDTSSPSVADDAITVTLVSQQSNAVQWLVPMQSLLAMSAGGAWKIGGGTGSDSITPTSIVAKPQVYNGCSAYCRPIVIGNDILYVQALGSTVRDLAYNFYADVYTGNDMSVLSNHLFFGYTLTDWAYAEEPFKVVWAIRSDGTMLSFTYLKEQDVYAWARHVTDGTFKAVATVPENGETAVYVAVQRTIGGNKVTYIERMASRNFLTSGAADVTKTWFVDCGLQYSGTATSTVTGLDHLNGKTVSILADGNVLPQQVVSNGGLTLPVSASTITVGLPFSAKMQTLNLDVQDQGGSIQGKRVKVAAVTVRLENSRGIKVGHDFDSMYEVKERGPSVYMGQPIPLTTGDERIVLGSQWDTTGSICIQQDNPLPCTILGVIPEIRVGDTPG